MNKFNYNSEKFIKPSLADGRNLLFDVLLENWSYRNNLLNIIRKLSQFIVIFILFIYFKYRFKNQEKVK